MAKPNIVRMKPVDSAKDFTVSMTYSGILPYSNRIIIYDATTLSVLYDNTTENLNYSIEQTVPANTLTNGKKYAVQGQVFDINGNASALSDKVYFWCLATPSFYFKDINDGEIFDTASIFANLVYEQPDWEDIGEYRFYLYSDIKSLLIDHTFLFVGYSLNDYNLKMFLSWIDYLGHEKKVKENKPVAVQSAHQKAFTAADIKDEDMMVAALIATAEYVEETKEKDARLVSIKQIG